LFSRIGRHAVDNATMSTTMLPLDLGGDAADDARTKLGGDRLRPATSLRWRSGDHRNPCE
jgi:hypothetical protein